MYEEGPQVPGVRYQGPACLQDRGLRGDHGPKLQEITRTHHENTEFALDVIFCFRRFLKQRKLAQARGNVSTSAHLGQVGNRKELLQLAHQTCDQRLQCCVELCSILNRKHFLRRQEEGAFISGKLCSFIVVSFTFCGLGTKKRFECDSILNSSAESPIITR